MGVNFNHRVFRVQLAKQKKKLGAAANPGFQRQFEEKKKLFLQSFDNHEVTREIQRGPTTQESMLPEGNLFSFIGFEAGEHPTTPMRKYLKETITFDPKSIDIQTRGNRYFLRSDIRIPTLDEVNNAANEQTPLEWADGRGWTDLIQKGITGFPRFLSIYHSSKNRKRRKHMDNPPSRSGTAIQVKSAVRGGRVGPIGYINELLAEFKAKISRNKR